MDVLLVPDLGWHLNLGPLDAKAYACNHYANYFPNQFMESIQWATAWIKISQRFKHKVSTASRPFYLRGGCVVKS